MNPDSPIQVGDRVVVREVRFGSQAIHLGRTGTVQHVRRVSFVPGGIVYRVNMDESRPEQVDAIRVERVTAPVVGVAESLIDPKRLQAATAAHSILGEGRLLDDLIAFAEYLADGRSESGLTAATADGAERESDPLSVELDRATAKAATDEGLEITDGAEDTLSVRRDDANDDDVVRIWTNGGETVYLKAGKVDDLVTYLTNCKLAARTA